MSRVAKTLKNAKTNIFFYSITIFVGFFSRKVSLNFLGDEFVGLVSLFQQILGFLNLSELGISTAIGYFLYQPLFKGEKNKITDIITYYGYVYRKIGIFVLSGGIIISLLLPFIIDDVPFSYLIVYYCFFSFLSSSLFGYFFNYHITLIKADQKEYLITRYYQGSALLKSLIQIALLYYCTNYYIWISIELCFAIFLVFILRWQIKKEYPWLRLSLPRDNTKIKKFPAIIKKVKQLVVHKMSFFVLTGTDQILIYSFVGLKSVAYYGNYLLVFSYLGTFVNKLFEGAQASVGNLVAENNEENTKNIFWEIMTIRHFLGSVIALSLYFLSEKFIILWLGESYLLERNILICMTLVVYIGQIRKPVDDFINAYGLFSDTWAPIAEAILNLTISIILGKLYGIFGVMLGTLISLTLIVLIWKPCYLFTKGFKKQIIQFWIGFIELAFGMVMTFLIFNNFILQYLNFKVSNFVDWIIFAICTLLSIVIIYSTYLYMVTSAFKKLIKRIFNLILKK